MPLIGLFHRSIIASLQTTPVVLSRSHHSSCLPVLLKLWLKHYCHWALQALLTISSENWLQSTLCTVWKLITMFLRVIDILWTLTGWWRGVLQQSAATVSVLSMCSSLTVSLYNYLVCWGGGRLLSVCEQYKIEFKTQFNNLKDDLIIAHG